MLEICFLFSHVKFACYFNSDRYQYSFSMSKNNNYRYLQLNFHVSTFQICGHPIIKVAQCLTFERPPHEYSSNYYINLSFVIENIYNDIWTSGNSCFDNSE